MNEEQLEEQLKIAKSKMPYKIWIGGRNTGARYTQFLEALAKTGKFNIVKVNEQPKDQRGFTSFAFDWAENGYRALEKQGEEHDN
jgi:hypothetical protein